MGGRTNLWRAAAVAFAIAGCDGGEGGDPPDSGAAVRDAAPTPDAGSSPRPDAGWVTPDIDNPTLPAVSGGGLLVTRDGRRAVAADPDWDVVWIVELDGEPRPRRVALEPLDEPGRVVEGPDGIVFVALRRGGAVVTIDVERGEIVSRRPVCGAPRGVDYDPAIDAVHVACQDGDLVTFPSTGGPETRRIFLDHDLRDVIVDGDQLLVSRFRSAELLFVDRSGTIFQRARPPSVTFTDPEDPPVDLEPHVAWRTVRRPDGGALMLHQRAVSSVIDVEETGYRAQRCTSSVVEHTVSEILPSGTVEPARAIGSLALGFDLAVRPRDGAVAIPSTQTTIDTVGLVFVVERAELPWTDPENACAQPVDVVGSPDGEWIAVAYAPDGRLIAQSRWRTALLIGDRYVELAPILLDGGHQDFHWPGYRFHIACVSCHPEGGDDGHVWDFGSIGRRRTQSLLGGILDTAPFHWRGDEPDLDSLLATTEVRMGRRPRSGPATYLAAWLQARPAPRGVIRDRAAVARGAALFTSPEVGCAGCHAGPLFTNNENADVGTGGSFQVPALRGVAVRAPYLHDGSAPTLDDALTHGTTTPLSPTQRADLIAYLESL